MYDAMKRHEVQVLKKAGLGPSQIAHLSGVSRWSVDRIVAEPPVAEPDNRPLRQARRIGRPSVAAPFEAEAKRILASEPDLPTVEILHRLRQQGYRSGKTAFYELVSSLRPTGARPMVRFEGLAGEFSQHDFGHVRVEYENGAAETVHFFASRSCGDHAERARGVPRSRPPAGVRGLRRRAARGGLRQPQDGRDRPARGRG